MPKFRAEMEPRASINGTISILTKDSNLATLKTHITAVSGKSNKFYELPQKMALLRPIWPTFMFRKFLRKFPTHN